MIEIYKNLAVFLACAAFVFSLLIMIIHHYFDEPNQ